MHNDRVFRVPRRLLRGVTSIEYALIASLIAIAILASLQATGIANGGLWGAWTGKFIAAVNGALGL